MSTQVQTIVSDGLSSNNAAQEHLALFAAIFASRLQPIMDDSEYAAAIADRQFDTVVMDALGLDDSSESADQAYHAAVHNLPRA